MREVSLTMSIQIQRHVAALLHGRKSGDESMRLQIVVHPSVLERLRNEDEQVLMALQQKGVGELSFRSDPVRHVEDFTIKNAVSGEVLYTSQGQEASGQKR